MSTPRNSRQSARRRFRANRFTPYSLYRRPLRYEPLEDRRLLAVVTVNTLSDVTNLSDNLTTLREAIFATNLVAGADTIEFAPALTANGPAKISLAQGEMAITDGLTINGPGSSLLTINASGQSRVFNVTAKLGDVSFVGLTIAKGSAASGGGGGLLITAHNVVFMDLVLSENIAFSNNGGGALVAADSFQVQNSSFLRNRSMVGSGGGIFTTAPTTIASSQFNMNSARLGGGLAGSGAVQLSGSTFEQNSTSGSGGGIWMNGNGSLTVTNSLIRGNKTVEGTAAGSGGGIGGEARVTVVGSRIVENESSLSGGGIGVRNQVTIQNSIISGNKAAVNGGGIYATGAIIVSNSLISNNSASSVGYGGGIFMPRASSAPLTIENTTISGNFASRTGGGISAGSSSILNSTISNNTARTAGGISTYFLSLRHSTVANNSAIVIGGDLGAFGGIVANTAILDHSIVAANHEARSGAPDISTPSFDAKFSLIGTNQGIKPAETSDGSPDHRGNLFGGPVHGLIDPKLGELNDNGGFTLPDGSHIKTHALLPGSPAINAGDLSLKAGENGVPLYDQRGEPSGRVFNGRIDIGAFEYLEPSDLNLVVDTLVDESDGNYAKGDLSLREAIQLANQYAGPNYPNVVDTIRFDPALTAAGPAVITLTKGELAIKTATNIVGPGAMLLTIDVSGNDTTPGVKDGKGSRVFAIAGPSSINRTSVSISGLTLTGGDTIRGGAIDASNTDLALTASKVVANSSLLSGGALYVVAGNLTVRESLISGNAGGITEGRGGGLYFGISRSSIGAQRLEIIDTEISNNSARNGGGGVSVALTGGSILIAGSTFSSNAVTGTSAFGGALQLVGNSSNLPTTLVIDHTTVDHNTSTGNGGGVLIQGCETTINNSTISNNASNTMGGGIHITTSRPLSLINSTISGNTAKTNGGGIWGQISLTSMLLSNNTIAGNSVTNSTGDNRGGGMYVSLRTMTSATIVGNTFRENTAGSGGGLYAMLTTSSAPLIVDQSTFANNKATALASLGGGLFVGGSIGSANISNSVFEHNESQGLDGRGGGVYLTRPSTVSGSNIVSNVSGRYGGGVFISDGQIGTTISSSDISNNSAINTKGVGGGIFSSGNVTILDSLIRGNTATMNGGGVLVANSSPAARFYRIERSKVENNSAALDGGGILANFGTLTVFASTVANNTAGRDGGGVWLQNVAAVIDRTTINKNSAVRNGGGAWAGYPAAFINSTISQNAAGGDGGGLWASNNQNIVHTTVYQNRSDQAGGGVFIAAGTVTIKNSIVASNTGPLGRDLSGLLGAILDVHYSLIGSNQGSGLMPSPTDAPDVNGNFIGSTANIFSPSLEPLASNGGPTMTHAPMPGSLVINAGDPSAVAGVSGIPQYDQRGNPYVRVSGGRIDMGAIEVQPGPLAGDYNYDGFVDAADYVVYRNAIAVENLQADGSRDGRVTDGDWVVWKSNYGAGRPAATGILPLQAEAKSPSVAYREAVDTVMTEAYRPLPRPADTLSTTTTNRSEVNGRTRAATNQRPQSHLRQPDSLLTAAVAGVARRIASAVDAKSSAASEVNGDEACARRATVHDAIFADLMQLAATL